MFESVLQLMSISVPEIPLAQQDGRPILTNCNTMLFVASAHSSKHTGCAVLLKIEDGQG